MLILSCVCVGASDEVVDLLPDPAHGKWTEKLPRDEGAEGDQMFYFDGKVKGIEVQKCLFLQPF